MQTFKVKREESRDRLPTPGIEGGVHGMRAPGRIVLVVREGSCWVRREDGSRESLAAASVVIWEPGDWVEYGYGAGEGCRFESYWSEDLSEQEWAARLDEIFGPSAGR